MKKIGSFFQLIRWPNLVFIAITQLLFHFCVVVPSSQGNIYSFPLQLSTPLFLLLMLASVCIAAGGYIINDYFDINIDQINKPGKMVVGKKIGRRWALVWHLIISFIGLFLSFYLSYQLQNWLIGIANFSCIVLLWYYSTSYKRRLLIGNVIISALTSWVILVLLVAEVPGWWSGRPLDESEIATVARLSRIGVLYAGFAFILSLVREVVKDLEDMEGDRKEGCKTMPIIWGIAASKVFVGVWMVVLLAALIITQVYVIQFGWWISASYILLLVVVPLIYIFKNFLRAILIHEFSAVSRQIKWIMLSGIFSMVFFMIYTR